MNLYDLLFSGSGNAAAVVGGGGKTSLMAAVAESASGLNRALILTTSTKIQCPCPVHGVILHRGSAPPAAPPNGEPILWVGKKTPGGDKWIGPPMKSLNRLISETVPPGGPAVLIEADGSAGRPIKAPGPDEPVIPRGVVTVAAVAGLSALGRPVNGEWIHRLDPFLKITGASPGEIITPEILVRLIRHPEGSFKGAGPGMRRLLILNQADTADDIIKAESIARAVVGGKTGTGPQIESVIIVSLRNENRIRSIIAR